MMQDKITASDRQTDDKFGSAVAISGDYAVVGAPYHNFDHFNENSIHDAGAAYVYKRNENNQWEFSQKIIATERHSFAQFGFSVDITDETILVGANQESMDEENNNYMEKAGAAYIFKLNDAGKWHQTQKICNFDRNPNDSYANAVQLDDNHIVIAATTQSKDENGLNILNDAGAVYIYRQDETSTWNFHQKIVAEDRTEYDLFGASIALYNNTLLVGAQFEDHDENGNNYINGAGSAYVFELNPTNYWFESQKIVAPLRLGKDLFGCSVDIYGSKIVIGAKNCATNENNTEELLNAGAAYVYEKTVNSGWVFDQKIVARDRMFNDTFGVSVAISSDYIMVGAENENQHLGEFISDAGAVYVYIESNEGEWLQSQKLLSDPRNEHSYFGHAIDIDGFDAILTADREDNNNLEENPLTDAGAVYTFSTNEIEFNYLSAAICENETMLLEGEERSETGAYFDFNSIIGGVYYYNITNLSVNELPSPVVINNLGTLTTVNTYVNYQWYLNGIEITGATEASFTPSSIGNYAVSVMNNVNCEDISAPLYYNTNLNIDNQELIFELYPNPAKDHIIINNDNWSGQINLLHTNGAIVAQWNTKIVGKEIFTLPLLDQGIYILQLVSSEGKIAYKRLHIIN